jgi:hypothetical protein
MNGRAFFKKLPAADPLFPGSVSSRPDNFLVFFRCRKSLYRFLVLTSYPKVFFRKTRFLRFHTTLAHIFLSDSIPGESTHVGLPDLIQRFQDSRSRQVTGELWSPGNEVFRAQFSLGLPKTGFRFRVLGHPVSTVPANPAIKGYSAKIPWLIRN